MSELIEPKAQISTILVQLDGVTVYQDRPEVIEEFPCLTYKVLNTPEYCLDKDIGNQVIETEIDIWADSSQESGEILKELQSLMIDNGYRLAFAQDIPDPEGGSHIATRFII